jgi:hypothetical protein
MTRLQWLIRGEDSEGRSIEVHHIITGWRCIGSCLTAEALDDGRISSLHLGIQRRVINPPLRPWRLGGFLSRPLYRLRRLGFAAKPHFLGEF